MLELVLRFFFGIALAPGFDSPLDAYLPCRPGLTVRYRLAAGGEMLERVRGPGKEPRSCVLDRELKSKSGEITKTAWMREHLPDRISTAGWVDLPTAFRPPILKAPLEKGRRWHFNRTDFEILAVDASVTVPAGTFPGTVVVRERAADGGSFEAVSAYARGVGLVRHQQGDQLMEAVSIEGR